MQISAAAGSLVLALGLTLAAPAGAAPSIGAPAPDFAVADTAGKVHGLAEFKGRTVILEWTNDQCPYVAKHYGTGNMQSLQQTYTGQGAVWLSVISSAPGTEGAVTASEADALTRSRHAHPTAVLLDGNGKMGHAYGARNTPHIYVVSPEGKLAYMGAIDDKPTTRPADVKTANNYLVAAMSDLAAGRPVATPVTTAYGCTVKYGN